MDLPAKLDIIMSVMSQLKYDAVGLGIADARIGDEFFSKAAANKLPVLDASPVADKTTLPYIVKDVGGIKVGVISFGVLPPNVKVNEYQLRVARFKAYKEVRSKCDVLILLDQANSATAEWLERNGARLGGAPDIVIGGTGRNALAAEQVVGKTHIVPSLPQAKELGVIDLDFVPGQSPTVTAQRIKLDEKFAEDEQIAKRVGEGILALGNTVPVPQPVQQNVGVNANPNNGKPYYSPQLCKACHQKQYEDWALTKHAKAILTLVEKKNTTPECLPCHSERYRAQQTYVAGSNPVAGVECATCHINALPHGLERKEMVERSKVDPKLCLECHTKDRSPTYDVKTYFPNVVHAGTQRTTTAANPTAGK